MGWLHALNCVCLTFLPTLLVRRLRIKTDGISYWFLLWIAVYYILTQVAKFILVALVLPTGGDDEDSWFSYIGEFLRISLNLGDAFGLYFCLGVKQAHVSSQDRPLEIGVLWALAHNFLANVGLLFLNIRAWEFDWKYLQAAVDANTFLISILIVMRTVQAYRDSTVHRSSLRFLATLVVLVHVLAPFLAELALDLSLVHSWVAVSAKFALTATVGIIAQRYEPQRLPKE